MAGLALVPLAAGTEVHVTGEWGVAVGDEVTVLATGAYGAYGAYEGVVARIDERGLWVRRTDGGWAPDLLIPEPGLMAGTLRRRSDA